VAATGRDEPCCRLPPHRKSAVLGDSALGLSVLGYGVLRS